MDKDIMYFQLGKLAVARHAIQEATKFFAGEPDIQLILAETYYALNRATNRIDLLIRQMKEPAQEERDG